LEAIRRRLTANTDIEIWWQDEARVGQKTKLTRRWAQRGTRPTAPKNQRTKSVWIFGAICLDLSRFSAAPGAHLSGDPFKSQGAFPA
jgi:hypothetical protein